VVADLVMQLVVLGRGVDGGLGGPGLGGSGLGPRG
jgi:hypothetical protein